MVIRNEKLIFFKFLNNKEAVEEWAQRPAVLARLRNLQDSYRNSKFGANVTGDLRPEFVLIHTFAHLIINQLSFECGYGSSSIRERIYCEKAENKYGMYGVLIYTASGDSEGSLGGLVRQGTKDHIDRKRLRGYIGRISKEKMLEVDAALAISIGIGYPNERRTHNV